ncbi:hypothetical protein D3C80_636240 [compost metagenome]
MQQYLHLSADTRLAAQLQAAAHHLAEIAADDQTQPCAPPGRLSGVVDLGEGLEQPVLILFADPDATVVNLHPHLHTIWLHCRVQVDNDPDLALLGKLDGIADQVGQHLLEAQRVQQHIEGRVGRRKLQLQFEFLLSGKTIENPYDRGHEFTRIDALRAKAQASRFDSGNVEDVANQFQQPFRRVVRDIDGRTLRVLMIKTLECQFKHADDCIHRRADLMAHRGQKRAFGPVGVIGAFFRATQIIEQLPPFADVDPATDNALHFCAGIPIGKNPVIDRQPPATNVQLAIDDQRSALGHHALVVGLVLPGFEHIAHRSLHDAFANDIFTPGAERLQVTVVATLQQPLAITYVDRMGRAIDQRSHELELVVQCTLGGLALLDLASHVVVPRNGNQQ